MRAAMSFFFNLHSYVCILLWTLEMKQVLQRSDPVSYSCKAIATQKVT